MSETRYMISDAAKKVDVETHVLRYWEEELEMGISRTELGHRYYTEEDIQTFCKIKELKERGLQLKAIKVIIPALKKHGGQPSEKEEAPVENIIRLEEKLSERLSGTLEQQETMPDIVPNPNKVEQFERIFAGIFKQVIQENNKELEERITNSLSKEFHVQLQIREEREEERYRRLDETIRAYQKKRQLVAVTKEPGADRRKWYGFWKRPQ